jgi:hypothetical protein
MAPPKPPRGVGFDKLAVCDVWSCAQLLVSAMAFVLLALRWQLTAASTLVKNVNALYVDTWRSVAWLLAAMASSSSGALPSKVSHGEHAARMAGATVSGHDDKSIVKVGHHTNQVPFRLGLGWLHAHDEVQSWASCPRVLQGGVRALALVNEPHDCWLPLTFNNCRGPNGSASVPTRR